MSFHVVLGKARGPSYVAWWGSVQVTWDKNDLVFNEHYHGHLARLGADPFQTHRALRKPFECGEPKTKS